MSHKLKIGSLLAPVAVAVAAALAPTTASANAVAQAYLNLYDFGFNATSGSYSVLAFTDSGDVSASINGGAAATDDFNGSGTFTLNKSVGPDAGSYAPLTALSGVPTQNYVASYSFLNGGNPATYDVVAAVDNVVSLVPTGVGTAQSNTNLTATFLIAVNTDAIFNLAFSADAFYRTMLDPFGVSGSANAAYSWNITVKNSTNQTVFYWAPDGSVDSDIIGGTELSDDFSLTQGAGINFGGFDFSSLDNGDFEATTNTFGAGLYSLTINHKSNADATLIPEPSALALTALGLFAAGFVGRRRRKES